jgi:hypothetical protein
MSDIPTPPPNVHLITYADDITIYSSHQNYTEAQNHIQPYLTQIHTWTNTNNLLLNAGKTTTTLFTPDPAEYSTKLTLNINNTILPTIQHPTILGLTFDPKLTFHKHAQNTSQKAQKTLNILKALTSTQWGKHKETIINTYKTITRPVMEYASTIWSPIIAPTHTNKLQVTQNTALRIATGCTLDTNTSHLHKETQVLPLSEHLKLHGSQLRQKAQHPLHPLHNMTIQTPHIRNMKQTIFQNTNNYTLNIDMDPGDANAGVITQNLKTIHSEIVLNYTNNQPDNKVLDGPAPDINTIELTLSRSARRALAQLRTNKSPLLSTYLHNIDPNTHYARHIHTTVNTYLTIPKYTQG